jgi:2-keto-4-pentenoate hydratase/2-oxohepta-3-ene-1,7-dioic acid hydratase in catechol pathway
MKLIRIGEAGREKPGVLLEDGTRLDVSGFGADYGEEFFGGDGISKLRNWLAQHGGSAPRASGSVRLGAPICRPSKIVCIGLNFRDHAQESGMEIHKEPVIFFKATISLLRSNEFVFRSAVGVPPSMARRQGGNGA